MRKVFLFFFFFTEQNELVIFPFYPNIGMFSYEWLIHTRKKIFVHILLSACLGDFNFIDLLVKCGI